MYIIRFYRLRHNLAVLARSPANEQKNQTNNSLIKRSYTARYDCHCDYCTAQTGAGGVGAAAGAAAAHTGGGGTCCLQVKVAHCRDISYYIIICRGLVKT